MNSKGMTIQIFLPEGEPLGIRIADIKGQVVQAILVPRTKLSEAVKIEALQGPGAYLLIGEPDNKPKRVVYFGETDDSCYTRFLNHEAQKEFWHTAIALVDKTKDFNKAHVQYLEWYCIMKTREVGRYLLKNNNKGCQRSLPEPMLAELMNIFDQIQVLITTLGFPIFEPQAGSSVEDDFVLKEKGCEGKGQLVENGFRVFKGSKARKELVPKASEKIRARRQRLLDEGVLAEEGNQLTFAESYTFGTPSGAAEALMGCAANGKRCWKNRAGRTLGELERQRADACST